jgi:translation initiation factor IF-3
MAEEAELDLVEVAPTADPPVCRIMDYGKFKYEQAKREKESRKGAKHSELREVRMRVKIDEHDIDFKARTARKLLADGDKVKVSVMFRAREITHPEVGRELLDRFYEKLRDVASLEHTPAMEGRMLSMVVTPGVKRERAPGREEPEAAAAAAVGSA